MSKSENIRSVEIQREVRKTLFNRGGSTRIATGSPAPFLTGRPPAEKYFVSGVITPCVGVSSLLEKTKLTAKFAAFGDVILLSPACLSFNQFRVQENGEELFPHVTGRLADATEGMVAAPRPNRQLGGKNCPVNEMATENIFSDLRRGFLRKNPGAKQPNPTPSIERTLFSATQP